MKEVFSIDKTMGREVRFQLDYVTNDPSNVVDKFLLYGPGCNDDNDSTAKAFLLLPILVIFLGDNNGTVKAMLLLPIIIILVDNNMGITKVLPPPTALIILMDNDNKQTTLLLMQQQLQQKLALSPLKSNGIKQFLQG